MFKKIAFVIPMAVLSLSSAMAFAADDARSSINISATIPSKEFHAQPRNPNFGADEKMAYNLVTGTLAPLRATYDVLHINGSVAAYVQGGPQPLSNGASSIDLTYTFNGVTLTETSQEVVGDTESNGGMQAELVIAAAKPADTQHGLFTATPVVIFDAIPRVSL
ncbi:CS1 type fimbrial major subunit [Pseudomonas sp. ANT_H12B]|uniref:CS1 type fimbrial major subunit n=1 Tax=Pseudomonas sp. ANT_H12B TaxID=2597348 RepID=UPI0011EEB2D5|nr:CS1 type fimbrial major subunit [Pseudomonas sp. ANT_H12B]KAA0960443.1 adhesin [Pseudomonas sp. ANT_H12B]